MSVHIEGSIAARVAKNDSAFRIPWASRKMRATKSTTRACSDDITFVRYEEMKKWSWRRWGKVLCDFILAELWSQDKRSVDDDYFINTFVVEYGSSPDEVSIHRWGFPAWNLEQRALGCVMYLNEETIYMSLRCFTEGQEVICRCYVDYAQVQFLRAWEILALHCPFAIKNVVSCISSSYGTFILRLPRIPFQSYLS